MPPPGISKQIGDKFMNTRFLTLPLFACLMIASILIAAQLPGHVAAQGSPLPGPISPLPRPTHPDSEAAANIAAGNNFITLPSPMEGSNLGLRLKTHQIGVGWWNACAKLAIALSFDGYADIPADAQEISIPCDIPGTFNLPGWKKTMKPNGEWVLRLTTATCSCTDGQPICR